jgi:hypothetical protein
MTHDMLVHSPSRKLGLGTRHLVDRTGAMRQRARGRKAIREGRRTLGAELPHVLCISSRISQAAGGSSMRASRRFNRDEELA